MNKQTGSRRFALHWPHFIVLVNNTIIGNGDNLELTFKHALPKEIEMLRLADKIELVKRQGVMMKGTKIRVLSKTIKTNKMPDIPGFIQAMKDMGAKVSMKGKTILVDLRI